MSTGKLTSFIVDLQKSRTARRGTPSANVSLDIGTKLGKLTVSNLARFRQQGVMNYECTCECGQVVTLNYNEVKKRETAGQGCLSPMCDVSKDESDLLKTDMDTCIKDQFRRMILYSGDTTCEEWGGTGSLLDLGSAYENFYEHMQELGAEETNGYWFPYRVSRSGLYEPGNVDVSKKDRMAGKRGEKLFLYEENILSVKEAATILGCEEEDILTLQEAMISDEDIYESLVPL